MDTLPISRPSDVDESLFGQYVPDKLNTPEYKPVWDKAYRWFQEQPLMQHDDISINDIRKALKVFEIYMIDVLVNNKVYSELNRIDHVRPKWFYMYYDFKPYDNTTNAGQPRPHYPPNDEIGKSLPFKPKNVAYEVWSMLRDENGDFTGEYGYTGETNYVEIHQHSTYERHRSLEDTKSTYYDNIPKVPELTIDIKKAEIERYLNNLDDFAPDFVSKYPPDGTLPETQRFEKRCLRGDSRRCSGKYLGIKFKLHKEYDLNRHGIKKTMEDRDLEFPSTSWTDFSF